MTADPSARPASLRAIGRELGVSAEAVRKAKAEGRVRPDATVGEAAEDWARNTDPARRRGAAGGGGDAGMSYAAARLRHELAKAEAQEMENAVRRGEYVRVDEVKEAIVRCVTAANAKLGAVPARLAAVISPDDPHTARRHLELAIEEVRAELRRLDFSEEAVAGLRDDA